nr:hypothetical protein [uncultured Carboxylicivirga sp.]
MKKAEFIDILSDLRDELNSRPEDYENTDLDSFLGAMIAYTQDIQGYYKNTGQDFDSDKQDYKVFADILRGAAVYE